MWDTFFFTNKPKLDVVISSTTPRYCQRQNYVGTHFTMPWFLSLFRMRLNASTLCSTHVFNIFHYATIEFSFTAKLHGDENRNFLFLIASMCPIQRRCPINKHGVSYQWLLKASYWFKRQVQNLNNDFFSS